jgi:hypothetical protein
VTHRGAKLFATTFALLVLSLSTSLVSAWSSILTSTVSRLTSKLGVETFVPVEGGQLNLLQRSKAVTVLLPASSRVGG